MIEKIYDLKADAEWPGVNSGEWRELPEPDSELDNDEDEKASQYVIDVLGVDPDELFGDQDWDDWDDDDGGDWGDDEVAKPEPKKNSQSATALFDRAAAFFEREWDEDEHPRHPKGHEFGGRFAVAGDNSAAVYHPNDELSPLGSKWQHALTARQEAVASRWGTSGGEIREAQRKPESKLTKQEAETLSEWNTVLDHAPKYDGRVWRGLSSVPNETARQIATSRHITLDNDQSATSDRSYVDKYVGTGRNNNQVAVLFEIDQSSGRDVAAVTNVTYGDDVQTGHVSESEVVLRKGTTYRVDSVRFEGRNNREVTVKETSDGHHASLIGGLEERLESLQKTKDEYEAKGTIGPLPRINQERIEAVRKALEDTQKQEPKTVFPFEKNSGRMIVRLSEVGTEENRDEPVKPQSAMRYHVTAKGKEIRKNGFESGKGGGIGGAVAGQGVSLWKDKATADKFLKEVKNLESVRVSETPLLDAEEITNQPLTLTDPTAKLWERTKGVKLTENQRAVLHVQALNSPYIPVTSFFTDEPKRRWETLSVEVADGAKSKVSDDGEELYDAKDVKHGKRIFEPGPHVGVYVVPGSHLQEAVMWVQGYHEVTDGERSMRVFTETSANRDAKKTGHAAQFTNEVDEEQDGIAAKQTSTPEFKQWFRGSKILERDGTPKVVYHGTQGDHAWTEMQTGKGDLGLHVGTLQQAELFARHEGAQIMPLYANIKNPLRLKDDGIWTYHTLAPQLVAAGINIPKEIEHEGNQIPQNDRFGDKYKTWSNNTLQKIIQGAGFDGIVYLNRSEGFDLAGAVKEAGSNQSKDISDGTMIKHGAQDSYIVFEPHQVKSALGNRGTFDPKEKDIRKSLKSSDSFFGRDWDETKHERHGAGDERGGEFAPKDGGSEATPSVKAWADDRFKDPKHAKAFVDWFGDSKIVDENGEPLTVYHGTNKQITEFDTTPGAYFTEDPKYADHYTTNGSGNKQKEGGLAQVMPVHIHARNPKYFGIGWVKKTGKFDSTPKDSDFRVLTPERIQKYKDEGYDALIMRVPKAPSGNLSEGFINKEIIIFDAAQVKSATGNQGTFDQREKDIRKSLKPEAAFFGRDWDESKIVRHAAGDERGGEFAPKDGGGESGTSDKPQHHTDTPKFKKWFGRSKIVDSHGKPLVVYHGTGGEFTEYKPTARRNSGEPGVTQFGFGLYLTQYPAKADAYANGENGNVMPFYVKIENPLYIDGDITEQQQAAISKLMSDNILEEYKSYHSAQRITERFSNADKKKAHDLFDDRLDHWKAHGEGYDRYRPDAERDGDEWVVSYTDPDKVGVSRNGRETLSQLMKTFGYEYTHALASIGIDGVVLPDQMIVTRSSQIKSATGNNGNWDESEDDFRKSASSAAAFFQREWDESKHERHGAGDERGGEFAPKDGGGESGSSDKPQHHTDTPKFKEWFGTSEVKDEAGKPLVVYHSTNAKEDFTEFMTAGLAAHFGDSGAADARHEQLADFSENVVGRDAGTFRILPVYLNIKSPLEMPDLANVYQTERGELIDGDEVEDRMDEFSDEEDEDGNQYQPHPMSWESDDDFSTWLRHNDIITDDEFWDVQYDKDAAVELLKEKGYDGIKYENAVENPGSTSWIPFDSSQIKSATGNRGTYDAKEKDISKSASSAAAFFQREWDESKIVRHAAGDERGGEFSPKDGGDSGADRELLKKSINILGEKIAKRSGRNELDIYGDIKADPKDYEAVEREMQKTFESLNPYSWIPKFQGSPLNVKQWKDESDEDFVDRKIRHADVSSVRHWMATDMSDTSLTLEKRKEYLDNVDTILNNILTTGGSAATARMKEGVVAVDWHDSIKAMNTELALEDEALRDFNAKGQQAGGAYHPGTGRLTLDGGKKNKDGTSTAGEIYAHELGHSIDNEDDKTIGNISDTPEWFEAWKTEAKEIGQYATGSPSEGFAEFSRYLWGRPAVVDAHNETRLPGLLIQKHAETFPLMTAVFQKHNLLRKV